MVMATNSTALATVRRNWRLILEATLTVLLIVVCSEMAWTLGRQPRIVAPVAVRTGATRTTHPPVPTPPSEPVSLVGAAVQGRPTAQVALIVYSDFQCPYCGTFARDTLPAIEKRYVDAGKLLLAFRYLPLEQMHPFALKAAEAAECAGRQQQFWPMHDSLFSDQPHLDDASLSERAKGLHLNLKQFDTCLAGPAGDKVKADEAAAKALGIAGTPTILLGTIQPDGRVKATQRLSGMQTPTQLAKAIDALLAAVAAEHK
jgi:protein-disulfide isomerase